MYLAVMATRTFAVPTGRRPGIRFHSAGYVDHAGGHVHIERPSLHRHEIFIVEHGVLHLQVDAERIAAPQGTVLFCPAGTHQRGYAPSPGRVRYVWMHFDAAVRELGGQAPESDSLVQATGGAAAEGSDIRTICIPLILRPPRIIGSTLAT